MANPNHVLSHGENSELTSEQHAIKQLADKILAHTGFGKNDVTFSCLVDSKEIEDRIRQSSIGSLLLPEGASLLEPYPYGIEPKDDLIIGEADIKSIEIRAAGYDLTSRTQLDSLAGDPVRWLRGLDINLWYGRTGSHWVEAKQILRTVAHQKIAQEMPPLYIYRDVLSTESERVGYIGHNEFTPEEVAPDGIQVFADLATELFKARGLAHRVF
jgi:hypothetical protein